MAPSNFWKAKWMGMVNRTMQRWNCWQKDGVWPTVIYKVLTCPFKSQHLRIPRQPAPGPQPSCLLALGQAGGELAWGCEYRGFSWCRGCVHLPSYWPWLPWPPHLSMTPMWIWHSSAVDSEHTWGLGVWIRDQTGTGPAVLSICWETPFSDLQVIC